MSGAHPVSDTPRVWFIGAGPGDPELITVKGQRLIRQAGLVVYGGSLVPPAVVADGGKDTGTPARLVDSSSLTLAETHALCCEAVAAGHMVARVHTGDPALYGAVREQMQLLKAAGIACGIVPGVTAAFAAAAAAGVSLTIPDSSQSVILTRLPGRTPVPSRERLADLAAHHCALAVYLSAEHVATLRAELEAAGLSPETPIICARRVGWPDELIVPATLATLEAVADQHHLTRQTVFLILPGEAADPDGQAVSRLYDPTFAHGWRSV